MRETESLSKLREFSVLGICEFKGCQEGENYQHRHLSLVTGVR